MISRATAVVPPSRALTAASSWAIGTALLNKGDEANSAEMTAEKDGAAEAASALEATPGVAGAEGNDRAGNASHGGEPRAVSPCGPGMSMMELRRRRTLPDKDGVRSNVVASRGALPAATVGVVKRSPCALSENARVNCERPAVGVVGSALSPAENDRLIHTAARSIHEDGVISLVCMPCCAVLVDGGGDWNDRSCVEEAESHASSETDVRGAKDA